MSCVSRVYAHHPSLFCFFFNDTATTEIYTLSPHDALPIYVAGARRGPTPAGLRQRCQSSVGAFGRTPPRDCHPAGNGRFTQTEDRKSTRLNSSHGYISYAVFCLKKKKSNTPVPK